MWEGAQTLLDHPPLCLATRPVAGAALGFMAGAVYGALCGVLHMAVLWEPRLFLPWLVIVAKGGTVAGCLMGFCTAVDRVVNRAAWEQGLQVVGTGVRRSASRKRRAGAVPDARVDRR
jgi:hypothetical protein